MVSKFQPFSMVIFCCIIKFVCFKLVFEIKICTRCCIKLVSWEWIGEEKSREDSYGVEQSKMEESKVTKRLVLYTIFHNVFKNIALIFFACFIAKKVVQSNSNFSAKIDRLRGGMKNSKVLLQDIKIHFYFELE